MAKPASRTPRTAAPAAGALSPAPNNGQAFSLAQAEASDSSTEKPTRTRKTNHQLGTRIPLDLYERLLACSDETGVPITRLVTRAIEREVSRLEDAR